MGFEGRTASSTVPDEAVPRIRAAGGHVRPGSKPRAATEERLPRRPAEAAEQAPGGIVPVEAGSPTPEAGNGQVGGAAAAPAADAVTLPEAEPESGSDGAPTARVVRVTRGATPQELADRLGASPADIVKILIAAGEMVSVTQSLPDAAIELVAAELGQHVEVVGAQVET